ncbi:MAG TPA: prolipoprotein diacylglyceryl transferase [Gammaproteobacteria bacterium]|nr:prolipoprotein diacylglyceryl transferase [Gammaproteobacteria bacterium]
MIWDTSPVFFHIGSLEVRYYFLCFSITIFGGYALWRWQAKRGGYREKPWDITILMLAVLIGSRLGHVLFYKPHYYFSHPAEILNFREGGLASHGATIGLLLVLYYFSRRENRAYLDTLDRFSFSVALGIIMVRIGNFYNSEIVGRVSDAVWAIKFPRYDTGLSLADVPGRHPSQLYEAILGALLLAVLLYVDRKYGERRPPGINTGLLFVIYFGGRFFLEYFKEYQAFSTNSTGLTMGQYLSIPIVLAGVILLYRIARGKAE